MIPKISDASFSQHFSFPPQLPPIFFKHFPFYQCILSQLKTLDFNMHWKSEWYKSGRENLTEKTRSDWCLILPCWYLGKAFKTSLSAGLSDLHNVHSVPRWPVLATSSVRLVQWAQLVASLHCCLGVLVQLEASFGKPGVKGPCLFHRWALETSQL